jgi:hypothetical protein
MNTPMHNACKDTQSCLLSSYCGKARDTSRPLTIWIVALDEHTVQLFAHRPGRSIEPLNVGCGCNMHAGNPDNLAKYLDGALACGKYDGIVLMGPENALKVIKKRLSEAVHNRIIAEIFEDFAGKNTHEIVRHVTERMAL